MCSWSDNLLGEHSGHLRCEKPPAVCERECQNVCVSVCCTLPDSQHWWYSWCHYWPGVRLGCAVWRPSHVTSAQNLSLFVCACICVLYYHPASAVALYPPLLTLHGGPLFVFCGFLLIPGPQLYCNTHMHAYVHTQCLVTEWCTG